MTKAPMKTQTKTVIEQSAADIAYSNATNVIDHAVIALAKHTHELGVSVYETAYDASRVMRDALNGLTDLPPDTIAHFMSGGEVIIKGEKLSARRVLVERLVPSYAAISAEKLRLEGIERSKQASDHAEVLAGVMQEYNRLYTAGTRILTRAILINAVELLSGPVRLVIADRSLRAQPTAFRVEYKVPAVIQDGKVVTPERVTERTMKIGELHAFVAQRQNDIGKHQLPPSPMARIPAPKKRGAAVPVTVTESTPAKTSNGNGKALSVAIETVMRAVFEKRIGDFSADMQAELIGLTEALNELQAPPKTLNAAKSA